MPWISEGYNLQENKNLQSQYMVEDLPALLVIEDDNSTTVIHKKGRDNIEKVFEAIVKW